MKCWPFIPFRQPQITATFMPLRKIPLPLVSLPERARDLSLDDIYVGLEVAVSWRAEAREIDDFAKLSGDKNPLHMSDAYAKGHEFSGRVVHGFLLGARVSGLIGMIIPGRRCLLLEEKLTFPAPVYIGDDILFRVSVEDVHEDMTLVFLKVTAKNATQTVLRGRVTCKLLF